MGKDGKTEDICSCNIIHEDIVERVKESMYDEELLEDVSRFFKIFSDKTRLRIVSMLLQEEMCVCDIAHVLNMSHSSISHQLRVLRQYRVVKNRKEGKVVYYSLDDEHVKNILAQGIEHHKHGG